MVTRRRVLMRLVFCLLVTILVFSWSLPPCALAAQTSPQARAKFSQAVKALDDNKPRDAIKLLQEAIKDSPEYIEAHLKLGQLYSENITLFDKAPVELMTVIELVANPRDKAAIDARYYLGIIFLKIGDYDKSLDAFRKVIELENDYPQAPDIYNYMGVAFYHKDMYKNAIMQFKKSIQLNPTEDKIVKFNLKSVYKRMEHYNLGMTYFFMKDYNAAITEMLIAIEVDSNYFDALYHLGEIYLSKGMPGEALRSFQRALRVNPNHADIALVYNGLGVALYKKEQMQKAVEMLRKALALRPNYGQARNNLRNILMSMDTEKLISVSPKDNQDKFIDEAMGLADDFISIGLYDQGIKLYQQITDLDYSSADVFDKLVAAYQKMGDDFLEKEEYTHAVNAYKRVIELKGENPQLSFKLGMCYFKQGKYWYNDALDSFTKAKDIAESRYYLGLIYFNRKEFMEAAFKMEESLKIKEDDSKAHFLLAQIYQAQERGSYAIDEIKRAIELSPDNSEYQVFLDKLSKGPGGSDNDTEKRPDVPSGEGVINPLDTPDILNDKGMRYAQNNILDRSLANFQEGLKKDPGSVELRNNFGLLLMLQGNLEEAEKELLTAELLNPMEAKVLLNLAILYHKKALYSLAKEQLEKAKKIQKKLSSTYDSLGVPNANISDIAPVWIPMKQ